MKLSPDQQSYANCLFANAKFYDNKLHLPTTHIYYYKQAVSGNKWNIILFREFSHTNSDISFAKQITLKKWKVNSIGIYNTKSGKVHYLNLKRRKKGSEK